jgi:Tfp pilus assembly protein FimT
MIVIAIIAIVAAIVAPGFLEWRNRSRLQGYSNNLKADFELAKMRAIKENALVAIVFNQPECDGYRVFVDSGPNEWVLDADERLLRDVEFPEGLVYDPVDSTFLNHRARFNGRGLLQWPTGRAVLMQQGDQREVVVNRVGRIRLN